MNKPEFAAICGQFCRHKQADEPLPRAPFVLGGITVGGIGGAGLGVGAGGIVGLIREALRKRKDGEQSDYLGAMIRNALGGAALGGLGGSVYGGVVGSGVPESVAAVKAKVQALKDQIRERQNRLDAEFAANNAGSMLDNRPAVGAAVLGTFGGTAGYGLGRILGEEIGAERGHAKVDSLNNKILERHADRLRSASYAAGRGAATSPTGAAASDKLNKRQSQLENWIKRDTNNSRNMRYHGLSQKTFNNSLRNGRVGGGVLGGVAGGALGALLPFVGGQAQSE